MKKLNIIFLLILLSFTYCRAQEQELNDEYYDKGYELLYYADSGAIDQVVRMIDKEEVDVDFTNDYGVTPIMFAAQVGHDTIVKFLISRNANINHQSYDLKICALTSAVKNDFLETAEILIRAGAGIDVVDVYDRTALHYAVMDDYITTADMLLYYEADPNIKDTYGKTPLYYAVEFGYDSIAKILIDQNANQEVITIDSTYLLHVAAENGNVDFIEKYADTFDLEQENDKGFTPLEMAVIGGQSGIVNLFLEKNCTIRDTISDSFSLRTLARSSGDRETKRIIRKLKIKDIHYPYLAMITAGYELTFNGDDFFQSFNIGLFERRYGVNVNLSVIFRGYERQVFYPIATDEFYQIRESRNALSFGFSKDLRLFGVGYNSYLSIYGEVNANYYFGKYDGMIMKVNRDLIAIPGVGFSATFNNSFKVFLACKYLELPVYDTSPIFYSVGVKGLINFRTYSVNEKYRYIINY